MAEVVKVPVVGNVKTQWLYVGGAAVAGIVGYAWWSRGTSEVVEDIAVELPATDYVPPSVVDSGISVGGSQSQGEPIARTNVEWRNMAQAEGEALGFTQAIVQSALTKYLGKGRLSLTEAAAMSAVVAILGQPPTGGPYSISLEPVTPPPPHEEPPPADTKPGAIASIAAQRLNFETVRISWSASARATSYEIKGWPTIGGTDPGYWVPTNGNVHDARLGQASEAPWQGGSYTYVVRGVNDAGAGPEKTIVFDA